MAATTVTTRPLTPVEIARATAAAIPWGISTRPILGILGVLVGAGLVTLTGRMLSLGMADLRGHVGISYDQAAWLDSAYNAALMFIGPFSVYLGGLLGPRRILLFAAGIFTATCVFLPLIHNYSLLVTALIVAGLTSGTFYPLTLTFALRISPLRYLPFTMAFYATFIDGAVNIAPSLYGWYRDHLSWHWMFWNSALIAPVMIILVYFGIPPAPARKKGGAMPSFAGFLYLSAGLALMFAAIQQGERLDWWRSGVFNALFWSGAFLTLCALIRRLRGPNPLVALPYLWQRNTILLGSLLFWFRFTLTGTIILIPQSLAIHGFEADQIGPAVIWSAVPLLLVTFIAGLLMIRNLDPRLLLAAGLACTAFAVCLNADYTSAWSAANYYRTELLTGVGQSVSLIGLVGCIILQGVFSGGLMKPQWILTFSAFFHVIRLFGGTTGAVYMGHFLADREKLHSNLLGLHVQSGNWITDANIRELAAGVYAKSSGIAAATGRAVGLMSGRVRLQSYTLSINDGFYLVAWTCVIALLLVALLRKSPLNYGDLSAFQQPSAAPQAPASGGKIMNANIKLLAVGLFFFAASSMVRAQTNPQNARRLTLHEAVEMALKQNHMVRISEMKIEEKQHAKDEARSAYFPTISNQSTLLHLTDTQFIEIAAGSLGAVNGTPIPTQPALLNQGGRTLVTSGTGLVQPLTQLITKVKPENDIARADLDATRANAKQTENEVALKVHQLYYSVLIAQVHQSASEARIKATEALKNERVQQVKYGSALDQDLIESTAQYLQAKQELLTTELLLSNLTMELDDVVGLPLTTRLELEAVPSEDFKSCKQEECVKIALESHPEIVAAREELLRASAAVKLSKADYIPDVSAFARYSYSDQVPFLARNFGSFGVEFTYVLFDAGRRHAALEKSNAQLAQARENLARVTDDVELQVQIAYNKLQRTRELVNVSKELLVLRTEGSRVSGQQLEKGEALQSQAESAVAQKFDAQTLLLQAQLGYIQAHDEMTEAMGLTPQ